MLSCLKPMTRCRPLSRAINMTWQAMEYPFCSAKPETMISFSSENSTAIAKFQRWRPLAEMWKQGYRHIAAEVSPWAARQLELVPLGQGPEIQGLWTRQEATKASIYAALICYKTVTPRAP
jgi:hypothetical protein